MPGLWKEWKAKGRLPTLSTSPWKSRQKQARFPHSHSADGEGGWKSGKPKTGFPLFHRHESSFSKQKTQKPRTGFAPTSQGASRLAIGPQSRAVAGSLASFGRWRPTDQSHERRHHAAAPFSGSPRIGIEEPFQAHLVLDSILDFRLICGLENAPHREVGSGSVWEFG
jgi:hypothetical protein